MIATYFAIMGGFTSLMLTFLFSTTIHVVITWLDGIFIVFILTWLRTYLYNEEFMVIKIEPDNNRSRVIFFGPKEKITKTKEE